MTPKQSRALITLCAGSAIIAGVAWTMTVRPLRTRLADARAALVAQRQQLEEFERTRDNGLLAAEQSEALSRRAMRIEQETSLAGSEDALFDEIERLASAHAVRVVELTPRRAIVAGSKSKSTEARRELAELHCTLVTEGAYGDLVRLVHAIETRTGLCKLAAVRLYADRADGDDVVISATIETVHYALTDPLQSADGGER